MHTGFAISCELAVPRCEPLAEARTESGESTAGTLEFTLGVL